MGLSEIPTLTIELTPDNSMQCLKVPLVSRHEGCVYTFSGGSNQGIRYTQAFVFEVSS